MMSEDFDISLFSDEPESEAANKEFKQFFDKFSKDLKALRLKWDKLGANDTAVSESIKYLLDDIVE